MRNITFIGVNTESVRFFHKFFKQSKQQVEAEKDMLRASLTQGSVENSVYF